MGPVAILAGGLATRLGAVAQTAPKALVDVAGKPFLGWQLELLHAQGFDDIVLCVGHLGEQIEAAVPAIAPAGMQVRFSYDGDVRRGTGGALQQALPLLTDPFLVLYGDSYLRCDYRAVYELLVNARNAKPNPPALGVMTVYHNDDQFDSSNVRFEGDKVVRYSKTDKSPEMRHIDWGLGILSHEAFADFASRPTFDLADVYEALVRRGQLLAYEVHTRFYEVGSPDGLRDFTAYVARDLTR